MPSVRISPMTNVQNAPNGSCSSLQSATVQLDQCSSNIRTSSLPSHHCNNVVSCSCTKSTNQSDDNSPEKCDCGPACGPMCYVHFSEFASKRADSHDTCMDRKQGKFRAISTF